MGVSRRWAGGVAAGLAALAAALLVALATELRSPTGRIALPGLHAPVTIRFDRHGIPWIRASTEDDAAEALGFLHARDRLVQMDLMRRAGAGELAAMIGPSGLSIDRFMRVLGTRRAAGDGLAASPAGPRGPVEG